MNRNYADSGHTDNRTSTEEIRLLYAISRVSARLARNLSFLAACQSRKGEKEYVKDGRDGYDHQKTSRSRCRY